MSIAGALAYCIASLLAIAALGQAMGEFYELRQRRAARARLFHLVERDRVNPR